MKLGYINYLNCYPFYHHMLTVEPLAGIDVVPGYPSELNQMMRLRALDMSPISAAAYAGLQDEAVLLPEFCLSSIGYVRSVVLVSRLPIEDLHGKKVGLSSASQTSVVLLKILLQKHYGVVPTYVPTGPLPSLDASSCDAALIIGNEAMRELSDPYVYDLGDLWMRRTGFPVVFAVFALRHQAARQYPERIQAVLGSYHKSLQYLATDRTQLIRKAKEKYPTISYDIDGYYRLLQYRFTPKLMEALDYYFSVAGELELLPRVSEVQYAPASIAAETRPRPLRPEAVE
jgi:chorismate dehydratase